MPSAPMSPMGQLMDYFTSSFGGSFASEDDGIALVCTTTGNSPELLVWWARYHLGIGFTAVYIYVHETEARPGVYEKVRVAMEAYRGVGIDDEDEENEDRCRAKAKPATDSPPAATSATATPGAQLCVDESAAAEIPMLDGVVRIARALISRVAPGPKGIQIVSLQVGARRVQPRRRARAGGGRGSARGGWWATSVGLGARPE